MKTARSQHHSCRVRRSIPLLDRPAPQRAHNDDLPIGRVHGRSAQDSALSVPSACSCRKKATTCAKVLIVVAAQIDPAMQGTDQRGQVPWQGGKAVP